MDSVTRLIKLKIRRQNHKNVDLTTAVIKRLTFCRRYTLAFRGIVSRDGRYDFENNPFKKSI